MRKHNGGYFRKILHVDMTSGTSRTEAIDDEFIERLTDPRHPQNHLRSDTLSLWAR